MFVIIKIIKSLFRNKENLESDTTDEDLHNFILGRFNPKNQKENSDLYEEMYNLILEHYNNCKNYTSVSTYLNFLLLKSNPYLERFFSITVLETVEDAPKNNASEIIKYTYNNLENLFSRHTTYGEAEIKRLKMMQFYNLQPPSQEEIYAREELLKDDLDHNLNSGNIICFFNI